LNGISSVTWRIHVDPKDCMPTALYPRTTEGSRAQFDSDARVFHSRLWSNYNIYITSVEKRVIDRRLHRGRTAIDTWRADPVYGWLILCPCILFAMLEPRYSSSCSSCLLWVASDDCRALVSQSVSQWLLFNTVERHQHSSHSPFRCRPTVDNTCS